jgi:general secretion pathway protein C
VRKCRLHCCSARFSCGRISLPLVVALVLSAALLVRVLAAVNDWRRSADVSAAATVQPVQPHAPVTDLAAVQALGLFGAGSTAPSAPIILDAAAVSGLDLRLHGVAVAPNAADSVAIIASNGRVDSYRIGATLPVGVAVVLTAVAPDHVVIDNNGSTLALGLYDHARQPAVRGGNTAALPLAANAAGMEVGAAGTQVQSLQQRTQAAARLAEIIEVSPAAADGALIGYRLMPGARLKDFVQLGFRDNDIVTAVNGIALTDVANLPELYRLMNEAGDVSFSLLRDGQPLTLQMTLAP